MNIQILCQCRRFNAPETPRCPKCGAPVKASKKKRFYLDYRVGGKRRREPIEAANLTQARGKMAEVRAKLDKGQVASGDLLTLGDLAKWYLRQPEIRAKRSLKRDEYCWAHIENGLGSNTRLRDITPSAWGAYRVLRLGEVTERKKPTAPATVNREHEVLRRAFNLAVKMRILPFNPLDGIELLPENNIRDRILSDEEMTALLDHATPLLADCIILSRYTGMRQTEVCGLTWDEVDLEGGCIRISPARAKEGRGKTIPLRVVHPITGEVFDGAEQAIRRQPRALHTRRVFLYNGQPVDKLRRSFATATREAGLEDFRFHDLRRSFIVWMARLGYSERLIMSITGHRTRIAFDRYRHVREDEVLSVAGKVDSKRTATPGAREAKNS